jgi:hypothetical protein
VAGYMAELAKYVDLSPLDAAETKQAPAQAPAKH